MWKCGRVGRSMNVGLYGVRNINDIYLNECCAFLLTFWSDFYSAGNREHYSMKVM